MISISTASKALISSVLPQLNTLKPIIPLRYGYARAHIVAYYLS